MNTTPSVAPVMREAQHDAKQQIALSHEEQQNRARSGSSSTSDEFSDDDSMSSYECVSSPGDLTDDYTWEDAMGNVYHTEYRYNDERALELRKERRRFTREREEERYQLHMDQMADEYLESQLPQDDYDDRVELDVSPTARVTVSSYLTQRKAHLSRQSRQRHGEGPRSVKARRIDVLSDAQKHLCAARKEGRSHKAASFSSQDGLTDLQSFERSGGSLSRWAYCDFFEC